MRRRPISGWIAASLCAFLWLLSEDRPEVLLLPLLQLCLLPHLLLLLLDHALSRRLIERRLQESTNQATASKPAAVGVTPPSLVVSFQHVPQKVQSEGSGTFVVQIRRSPFNTFRRGQTGLHHISEAKLPTFEDRVMQNALNRSCQE